MSSDLADQAEQLAADLTDTLQAAVSDEAELRTAVITGPDDQKTYILGNRLEPPTSVESFSGEPIIVPQYPTLAVRAHWQFVPNSTGRFLKTQKSGFGLYVLNSKKDWSPFIRLEVDPKQGHDQWLAAHINLTGESTHLGYVRGLLGKPPRRLQGLHLPVGGFRYRPCLEDFLEFAIDEGLLPEREGALEALTATRNEYRLAQLRSVVSKYPEEARQGLIEAGMWPE